MDIEGNVRCGIVQRASRSGLAKTALRASTLTALGLLLALAVLLPNAAAEAQTSPASTATATATPTDYDSDNDGLIDIKTLAQLNAVRHDLDGNGKQGSVSATDWATYTAAFPNPASGMGCKLTGTPQQPTCKGYELMQDLDFDTDGDGDVDASDTNSYANWAPIGTTTKPFDSKFEGSLTNGVMPKISNLTISGELTEVGLFGATGSNARIENVGLVDVNVNTTTSARNAKISALVGNNAGKIIACYSTGAITATAGAYPDAGGLVGYNGGTIAAAFSRATVYTSSSSEVYVGGLVGYNGGTITATYSAGAVKGKGGSGVVGGLVGYNVGTINASYSIAPVTSVDVDPTNIRTSKPTVLGLSYNESGFSTVTASYWDYIASGVPDDADDVAPEGWHTAGLANQMNVSPTGWFTLTIDKDDPNDDTAWEFSGGSSTWYPRLTYGGHTIDQAGNQQLATLDAIWWYEKHPVLLSGEGMIFRAGRVRGVRGLAGNPVQATTGVWIWESSVDGIDWTTLSPLTGKDGGALRAIGGNSSNTHLFIPRPEHVGKYIRAKIRQSGSSDYLVSGAIKIKAATTATTPALRFASGNPPLVGRAIAIAIPSSLYGAVALWYSCDSNTANPPGTGCELVGSRSSYTPGGSDYGRYLYAHIYHAIYHANGNTWFRANTGFTQRVGVGTQRTSQWRTTE